MILQVCSSGTPCLFCGRLRGSLRRLEGHPTARSVFPPDGPCEDDREERHRDRSDAREVPETVGGISHAPVPPTVLPDDWPREQGEVGTVTIRETEETVVPFWVPDEDSVVFFNFSISLPL